MADHPFILMLDDGPTDGHLFGDLKMAVRDEDGKLASWVVIDRRCRLCHKQPLELLTIHNTLTDCEGLTR